MGACTFSVDRVGKTMDEAFRQAVSEAQWENGHGGYTGTIAEKDSFVRVDVPKGVEVKTFVGWIENDGEDVPEPHRATVEKACRIHNDKWGPAVGIEVKPGRYVFLGRASS